MERPKVIRKRIKSVTSTRKITSTMEMIASARLKKAQDRVLLSRPYFEKLVEVLDHLGRAETRFDHPFFRAGEERTCLIFLVTANRGLCGGYNTNLVRLARDFYAEKEAEGKKVVLHVVGKKGVSMMRYRGYDVDSAYTELGDAPTFADGRMFTDSIIKLFLEEQIDAVYFIYAHYESLGKQPPIVKHVLPVKKEHIENTLTKMFRKKTRALHHYLFEPDAKIIMETVIPLYLDTIVYQILAEATTSEQIARRIAMKTATDAAEKMIKNLTRVLNRSRQAQITREITEVVSGADALE